MTKSQEYYLKHRERILTYAARYREAHRDEIRRKCREKQTSYHRKSKYGMTMRDYDSMLHTQGGVCAICGSDEPGPFQKYFAVDHCHDTGKNRGLLCFMCNTSLGGFKDSVEILQRAIDYLRVGHHL